MDICINQLKLLYIFTHTRDIDTDICRLAQELRIGREPEEEKEERVYRERTKQENDMPKLSLRLRLRL